MANGTIAKRTTDGDTASAVPFGSNEIRLSVRQWVITCLVAVAVLIALPTIWEKVEAFEPGPDYRIPEEQSPDYWLFRRHARKAVGDDKILLVGDSVVWGQYVAPDGTLSHFLNETVPGSSFANLGVNGMHPAALAGLVRHHGRALTGRRVLLHCNLLWMSSIEHDLRIEKEFNFNHQKLVPQFYPSIPCYRKNSSARIGIVLERYLPFLLWSSHLRISYFDNMDLSSWTLEHPYRNPAAHLMARQPIPIEKERRNAVPWTEKGIGRQNFQWVAADRSFQWERFQEMVHILKSRGCGLLVVTGPFNEQMIDDQSLQRYRQLQAALGEWFQRQKVPHVTPPVLPTHLYADASHPLAVGYKLLAQWLAESPAFHAFMNGSPELDGGGA